jgi:hypothetical protein
VHQRLRLLLQELHSFRRVLTFDYAGLRQRRFGSRRLRHRLGSESGFLGGRRDFFRPAEEGSTPSQDRSVDFLQKHTQLVVSQPRLLQQVLLAKMRYLQVRPDYCHGRGTKDAGDIDQSTLGGRLLLRPCGYRLLCSNGGRRSALLRS